jgi:hypothetical protein
MIRSEPYPFFHCVASAGGCNSAAHGGRVYVEVQRTPRGTQRRQVAVNGRHHEEGEWEEGSDREYASIKEDEWR